jgi:AcrR family transcriptional regulator
MRTVSRVSGVSIGTIYKYFPSKEDLLFGILNEKIGEIWAQMELHIMGLKSFKEIFRKILWVTMNYYDHNPGMAVTAFITVPTRTWMQHKSFRVKKNIFIETLENAKRSGQVDSRIDVRRFQDIYYMICYRCIHTWYYFGRRWNLVDAVDDDFEIFYKMLAPVD